jgi:hypothetical protein
VIGWLMSTDRGNRSAWRELVPVPFCALQTPRDLSLTGGVFMGKQLVHCKAGSESQALFISISDFTGLINIHNCYFRCPFLAQKKTEEIMRRT